MADSCLGRRLFALGFRQAQNTGEVSTDFTDFADSRTFLSVESVKSVDSFWWNCPIACFKLSPLMKRMA
jgi:hypothetical protein